MTQIQHRSQALKLGAVTATVLVSLLMAVPGSRAVVGGEIDGTGHPYVGANDTRPCGRGFGSGVLLSPTVFVMSGHGAHFCLDVGITRSSVTFDPVVDQTGTEGGTFHWGTIHAHPGYAGPGKANDVGLIVFDEPISGITPARLGSEAYLDAIGPDGLHGQIFETVGYGVQRLTGGRDGGGGPPDIDRSTRGTRKVVREKFLALAGDKLQLQMHENGSTCTGDSGSPALFEGTNLIASISVAGDAACRNYDEHQRLDTPEVREFLAEFVALP